MMRFVWVIIGLMVSVGMRAEEPAVGFRDQIAPILVEHCLGCHNADLQEGNYSLATFELLTKGGNRGKPIEPGNPEKSLLSQMMHGTEEPAMPFEDDPLDSAKIELIDAWIRQGAAFDGGDPKQLLEEMTTDPLSQPSVPDPSVPIPITAMAFHPEGKVLAVSGYQEITFWDASNGALVARWPTKAERILDLAYHPDGTLLLHAGGSPGREGEVVLWDVATGKPTRQLFEGKDVVFSACFRPGAREVAAGGTDRTFRIWNIDTGEQLHAVENHADWILDLAYTPDGHRLLTASRDRSAKVWDQTTGEPILTFAQHTGGIFAIAASPDGAIAASIGSGPNLRLWKTDGNGDQTIAVAGHRDEGLDLLYATTGTAIYTAGGDRRVVAFNPADGKIIREFAGHTNIVYSLALNRDESLLASGSWDGEVRLWNPATGELVRTFVAHAAPVTASVP